MGKVVPKNGGKLRREKGKLIHVLPGVFAYQNEKFVASQLFHGLRININIHEILNIDTFQSGTFEVENGLTTSTPIIDIIGRDFTQITKISPK